MTLTVRPDQQLPPGAEQETPGRKMSVLKARCIARYRMHTTPGRPEELESNTWPDFGQPKVISFGYIHGSVRIRQHGGERNRDWVGYRDITFKDGWLSEVYDYLDSFFGYVDPARTMVAVERLRDPRYVDVTIRPIKDNPQA